MVGDGQLAAPRRRRDVRQRAAGDVVAVDRAGRAQPHPARVPRPAGQPAPRQDRAVRDRHRRVLRAEAARALRRRRGATCAARFARGRRVLARGRRRGRAESSALRSCRWPARAVGRRRTAEAAVSGRHVRRRRAALGAGEAAASARPREFHSGTGRAARGQRPARTRRRRPLRRARRHRALPFQRRPHAGTDARRDRRPARSRRRAARRPRFLRRPDSRPRVGARADHHGLRPLPGATR